MRSARDDYPTAAAAERHPSTPPGLRAELTAALDELDQHNLWLEHLPDDMALRLLDGNPPDGTGT